MKKYIVMILSIICILSIAGCGKKEVLLTSDELWKSVTEVSFFDFNEDIYTISDASQLEELHTILKNLTYKEIENPWLEGWYMFEIRTNQNTYHFSISGKTINFNEKFYKVSDSISEEILKIIKNENIGANSSL